MNTRTKSFLIYIGGIVTGIILTFAYFHLSSTNTNDKLVMFDEPRQEIYAKVFEIMQVLPNGNALATVDSSINYGMVVLFLAGNETSYYDDQKIYVSSDMRVMQVGTFRYMTREEMVKAVPVVAIMDK